MNFLPGRSGMKCAVRVAAALGTATILLLAAGCGSSSSPNVATPPPGGSFSNSSLNGTYVFSYTGFDVASGGSALAIAGVFTADGKGGISGGAIDFDDPAGVFPGQTISGGSYNITADGRGRATLNTSTPFGAITVAFVLSSSSQGLIIQFDGNGSGSGTIDLQSSGVAQSSLQGSYAFSLNGVDSTGSNLLSTVGAFTLDSNGNISAGLQDFNDQGNSFNNLQPFTLTGAVLVGSPSGSAQLTTNLGGFGTLSFHAWIVDATHLKFIETDSIAVLAGDAFVSTGNTSFPSGSLVFTMAGQDTNVFPFATAGLFTSDGTSQITNGVQDLNVEGTVVSASNFTGSFSSVGGRPQLTLNNIFNGVIVNNTLITGNYIFAAYPYTGGVELMQIGGDQAGVTTGVGYVQAGTTFNASQGTGMNFSGANLNAVTEVDQIAEFSGANLSGLYDVNNAGVSVLADLRLGNGSLSFGNNGRGTLAFPSLQTANGSQIGALNFNAYVVNSSTTVLLETDTTQLALGSLVLQGSTPAPGVRSMARLNVVRSKSAGAARKRKLNH